MKKTIILFALLSVIFLPNPSVSQAQFRVQIMAASYKCGPSYIKLSDIGMQLLKNGYKLKDIANDLYEVALIIKSSEKFSIGIAATWISEIATICFYEAETINLFIAVHADYQLDKSTQRKNFAELAKFKINENHNRIRPVYVALETSSALHLIDRAKEAIQSSLALCDESIKILQFINQQLKTEIKQDQKKE